MSESNINLKLDRSSFLKLKTEIQTLFDKGRRINYSEIRIVYSYEISNTNAGLKVFVAAPKRLLNKATDRNTSKRRMREALRLNCDNLRNLCLSNGVCLHIGVIHAKESLVSYNIIEQKIVLSLQKIYDELYETLQKNKSGI